MPSSETFDVILKLLMDDAALKRVRDGASKVADEFEEIENASKKASKSTVQDRELEIAVTKKVVGEMKKEAAAINRLASLRAKELGELKERAAWIESGAKPMLAAGVAGFTAITMLAKSYIDTTEETNAVTEAWAASSQKVQDAQMRIGKISAEAILPLYEKLADIAQKGAEFVEKNPGVIEAGLKASMVLAGLGGIGLLAAKGMRLYADVKMIAVGDMQLVAAKLMSDAANKQLAAAGKVNPFAAASPKTGLPIAPTAAAGGVAGSTAIATAAQAALVVAAPIIAGFLTKELINSFQRAGGQEETSWSDIGTTFTQVMQLPIKLSLLELSKIAPETASKINNVQNSLFSFGQTQNAVSKTTAYQTAANKQLEASSKSTSAALQGTSQALPSVGSSIVSFIQRIISSIGGSSNNAPIHDYTGYAYSKTYRMANDGKKQFVMSGNMTRLAEQMLGGQLNQQMVMSAMAGGGNSRVVWQDQRRFSGEYTKSMRNAQRADTLSIFGEVAKNLGGKK